MRAYPGHAPYRYRAELPVIDTSTLDQQLTALAIELEQLRYDNRDPSAFSLGKIDIERGMRRIARAMQGRR